MILYTDHSLGARPAKVLVIVLRKHILIIVLFIYILNVMVLGQNVNSFFELSYHDFVIEAGSL
jgi:hypothetical protein